MKNLRAKVRSSELVLLGEILTYSVIFSYFTYQKFRAFSIFAWDFGVYSQAIATTVNSGRLFYSTLELPYTQTVIPPGTQLAVHFSPFLFVLLPVYALIPNPITLLAIKSVGIALGSVPVYLLAKYSLGSARLGILFSTAYLLSPALQGVNSFDFQPQAFLPTFLLLALLYLEKGQAKATLAFLLLALSTVELAPLLGILIGISSGLSSWKTTSAMIRKRQLSALSKSLPARVILVSCAWLAVFYTLSILLGWQGSFHASNLRRVSLVSSSLLGALTVDWPTKLLFVVMVFAPIAFLSFFDLPRLLPAGFWMGIVLLSNYPPYYQLGVHYPVFVIPFVIYSSIFGFKKLRALSPHRGQFLPILLCCTMLLSAMVASPLGYINLGNWAAGPPGIPTVTSHNVLLQKLVDLIPDGASVLTQNNIFAHLSERPNAYAVPFSSTFPHPSDFYPTLDSYLQLVDYVLFDGTSDPTSATLILSQVSLSSSFGVFAEADGALLLRRGYTGFPVLYVPFDLKYDHSSLAPKSGSIVEDASSVSGFALYRDPSQPTTDFWYGPGVFLVRGNYSVAFRMKIISGSASNVITLFIADRPANVTVTMEGSPTMWYVPSIHVSSLPSETQATTQVTSSDLSPTGQYQTVTMHFHVERPAGFEFDGLSAQGGVGLYLDTIRLSQVSP